MKLDILKKEKAMLTRERDTKKTEVDGKKGLWHTKRQEVLSKEKVIEDLKLQLERALEPRISKFKLAPGFEIAFRGQFILFVLQIIEIIQKFIELSHF